MDIVLGMCDGFLLVSALGKKIYNQEFLLDGDCVGSLLGIALGVIFVVSVDKTNGDKVDC